MSFPVHPMDNNLALRGWKRAKLDDLGGASDTLAARLICRGISLAPGVQPPTVVIDANLWLQGGLVRVELAMSRVPSMLQLLVLQGRRGVTPHGLGLTPCKHEPWHWNPFCLPLVRQEAMYAQPAFDAFMRRYLRALDDSSWQCPDATQLMQQA